MSLGLRMTLTAAVACVLVSTGLYPLFHGAGWFYAGIGAVITVAACGALSRLRTLPVLVCLAIGVLGLLLYLNLIFEAGHSWLVLPTPDSISRLWDLAGTGMTASRRYAPPAPELAGLVLLATAGIGITAILTDLIAVRLRSAALAGLPLLVLFTAPVTMNAQHQGLGTAVVFCLGTAGYLAMLSADGRERIRIWGRLVSLWQSGSPHDDADGRGPGPDTRALAAAGRRVGLASIVLALCVPLILPGLHPSKLFSSGPGIGGSGGTAAAAIALPGTLSQTLRELQESHPAKVLTYTTTASRTIQADDPSYLQTYVYDDLTDSGWQTSDYTAGEAPASAIPPPPGVKDPGSAQQFKISVDAVGDALASRSPSPTFLPVPYPATQVAVPAGGWLVDPELMIFSQANSAGVQHYEATSLAIAPSAGQLSSAQPPPAALEADLALPPSYQVPELKAIADQITASYHTEYGKVNALATWLSGPQFGYSTTAPSFGSAAGLLTYLTKGHAGVCVQSAYAMTVLTRLLGIPARLSGGYTEGTQTSPGAYVVTTDDAHAWAEVYFSGYGWIKFEATPGGGDGTARAGSYQGTATGTGSNLPPTAPGSVGSASQPATSPLRPRTGPDKLVPEDGGAEAALPGKPAGTPWAAVALAVVAAIALAGGVAALAAPPAQRAIPARAGDRARRPSRVSPATAALGAGAVAIVALAVYRVLSHTAGLDLRAGWATVGIAFGAACAVVLVAPGTGRVVLRRWRWLRARDDAGRAHAAWREFRDDLQDLGLGYSPSEPPRTLADRVSAGLAEPARDAVRRLALAEERASYAARPSGSANLRRDGSAARRGVAATVPRGGRWRARIFPVSVMTALADAAARVPDQLAALLSRPWSERRSGS